MHVADKVEQREHNVSKNDIEERSNDRTRCRFGHEADIAFDVQRLVACVDGDDNAKDKRFYNCKDKVGNGKRLDDFGRKVIPGDLQVGRVTCDKYDSLRDEEASSDCACTKDDVRDNCCDCTADNARHDQVTDGVDAHGGECVHFGINDHATDVGRERRT